MGCCASDASDPRDFKSPQRYLNSQERIGSSNYLTQPSSFSQQNLILNTIQSNDSKNNRIQSSLSLDSYEKKLNFVPENKSNISSIYKFKEGTIGTGSFGEVRKATNLLNGSERAIKIIYKHKMKAKELEKIMLEIYIMIQLDHPNIVKIYEYFIDEKFLYIVMEVVSGGELFDKIQEKKRFSEAEASEILFQMLSAINYLHKNNIVHRDIKPENILLEGNSLKLIDFGCSREFFKDSKMMTKVEGTPYYIAPEVLEEHYNEKCDEWSIGVIMYILLSGRPPFNGPSDDEIFAKILKGKFSLSIPQFDSITNEAKDLITKLLARNFKDRISAEEALRHPWFSNKNKSQVLIDPSVLKTIQDFNTKTKFEQSVYHFFVNQLASKEEKESLTNLFKTLDKNSDGVLSYDELLYAYKYANTALTEQDFKDLFVRLDTNGSKQVEYTEFIAAALDKKKILTETRIEQCFKMFDKNGDNKISAEELRSVFEGKQSIEKEYWELMIKDVDENQNGEVDFDEFKKILNKIAS